MIDRGQINRRRQERRRKIAFRLRERRTGFDRRDPSRGSHWYTQFLRGLRRDPQALFVLLVGVNLLNLADFALTLDALQKGAGEANPVMRALFAQGPVLAGFFKISIIAGVSLVIWRLRRFRRPLEAGVLALFLFGVVFTYHIAGRVFLG